MKEIVDILLEKKIILKKLNPIDVKLLKSRKKIKVFEGVDLHSSYVAIFFYRQKSRFLRKDILDLDLLYDRLIELQDHNFKKKMLIYDMPMCSHAKKELKEQGWRLIDVTS